VTRVPLLLLFALSVPCFAHASVESITLPVNWSQNRAANPGGGLADSSEARRLGTATPVAHDTSSWIDISKLVMPEKGAGQLPTASDSISWLRIDFFPPKTTPTISLDSLYITIQVSNDGVISPVSCTPTTVFDITADGLLGAVILEQATTNTFYYVLRQRVGAVASGDLLFPIRSSSTAPTYQQIYGWQRMRIIVQSDRTGPLDAKVRGFAAK